MRSGLLDSKGLTIAELMVAAMVSAIIIAAILSVWLFAYRSWIREGRRTHIRIDLLKTTETIKRDIRASSATYMSFYPSDADTYTAVSMPAADADEDGFYTLNVYDEIDWTRTVIYHIFTDGEGNKSLRRTVFDPRDNTMSHAERYTQLANVVTTGTGGAGSTTDTEFLENLDNFAIKALPFVVDFYLNTDAAQRTGRVVFGWERLDAGEHTIRFEVTGKNDAAINYRIGIDCLEIEPCWSRREAEYYASSFAPAGALSTSGEVVVIGHAKRWSNRSYLRFRGNSVGDYIEFTDYYDLWRESTFMDSAMDNVYAYYVSTDALGYRAMLELPEDRVEGSEEISWFAYAQSGDSVQAGQDGYLPGYPITLRTIVSNDDMDAEGDLVRVRVRAPSTNPFAISRAYITRKDDSSDRDGLPNQTTSGRQIDEYHRHQQLFFKDIYDTDSPAGTDDIVEYAYIPAGGESWSEWVGFPLILQDNGNPVDYFITICIPDLVTTTFPAECGTFDPAKYDCLYWQDPESNTHTYYITGEDYSSVLLPASGTPVWSGTYSSVTSVNIYAVSNIDTWPKVGTVESSIFDTGKDSPTYVQAKWSEYNPEGTEILLKARSSDDAYMDTAPDWSSISGSTVNPHSLSIGSGRYVQFLAELSTDFFWEAPGQKSSYAEYVDAQAGSSNPWEFPVNSGEYLVTGMYSTWIDDVEIDWPGNDRICIIAGYLARDINYGQAKVMVDGRDLVRVLGVDINISTQVQDLTITEKSSIEVEPANTGK